jgi:NAD-dependent deacetylase
MPQRKVSRGKGRGESEQDGINPFDESKVNQRGGEGNVSFPDVEWAAGIIRSARKVVALTGAGMSEESGVPTFRFGDHPIWETVDPTKFTLDYFKTEPEGFWKNLRPLRGVLVGIRPNAGHYALADMERRGFLKQVITQNFDGLHEEAGSRDVIEVHGNLRNLVCLPCKRSYPAGDLAQKTKAPRCERCGEVLKPDTVLFGEKLSIKTWNKAVKAAKSCDVLLLIGTSGQIPPACWLPAMAREKGARIVEVNTEPTMFPEVGKDVSSLSPDVFVRGKAGEVLPALLGCLSPGAEMAAGKLSGVPPRIAIGGREVFSRRKS